MKGESRQKPEGRSQDAGEADRRAVAWIGGMSWLVFETGS